MREQPLDTDTEQLFIINNDDDDNNNNNNNNNNDNDNDNSSSNIYKQNVIFSKLFHFLAAGIDPVIFGVSDHQGFAVHHSGS